MDWLQEKCARHGHEWHCGGQEGEVCYRCGAVQPYPPEALAARDARLAELAAIKAKGGPR